MNTARRGGSWTAVSGPRWSSSIHAAGGGKRTNAPNAVKAALVASSVVPGLPAIGDEVIAVTWDRWPPAEVVSTIADAAGNLGETT